MPENFRFSDELKNALFYPGKFLLQFSYKFKWELIVYFFLLEYWNQNVELWGDVIDWDIWFIRQQPSCTSKIAHMALAVDLDCLLEKLPSGSFPYARALALRTSMSKVRFF